MDVENDYIIVKHDNKPGIFAVKFVILNFGAIFGISRCFSLNNFKSETENIRQNYQ